ncbi:MAG: DUF4258 domain-containing protein [Candidatus Coatesbacteria bacterium]|nr:DUF4258 domain-containing protein [Candidatus Coatesbacteria bacterium]
MRLGQRSITREQIIGSMETLQIIEKYRDDRYLPCCLVLARHEGEAMHIVVAVDEPGDNVRIVTAYEPGPDQWDASLKIRRKPG